MALFALWLADYQLLAAALLLGVMLALAALRQPAQRLAVAKSTLAALAALALLCALPGWSLVHLLSDDTIIAEPDVSRTAPAPVFSATLSTIEPTPDLFNTQPPESPAGGVLHTKSRDEAEPASPISWSTYLVTAYAAGSAAVTLWLITGAILARRVRQQATPAPRELQELLQQLCGPEKTPPQLLLSDRIAAPVALSLRRPTILLPLPRREGLGEGFPIHPVLSESQLLPILAHELAHLQHRDLHTLAATRLLLILLWPQPLYWLLRRTIRLDQETLADPAAADRAGRLDYAQQLLAWASSASTQRPPRLAGAVGLWEGPSQLKRRIAVLLNEQFNVMRSCSRRWKVLSVGCIISLAIMLSLVTLQPALSAPDYEDQTTSVQQIEQAEANADKTPEQQQAVRMQALVKQLTREPNVFMGYCIDEVGQPLAGVDVSLFVYDASAKENVEPTARTKSAADGRFEFNHPIDVAKEFPNGVPEDHFVTPPVKIIAAVAKSPGLTTEFQNEALYQFVKRGQAAILQMKPAQKLAGRVTDDKGQPVANAVVTKTLSGGGYVPSGNLSVRTDAEGRYVIDDLPRFDAAERDREYAAARERKEPWAMMRPPGPALSVQHPDFAAHRVSLEAIPGEVNVELLPGVTIKGRVIAKSSPTSEDVRPLANVPVWITRTTVPIIEPRASYALVEQQQAMTDAEGNYSFTSLPAGGYSLTATAPDLTTVGVTGVGGEGGQTTIAADVVLTPGAIVRTKLLDAATKQPLKLRAGQKGYVIPKLLTPGALRNDSTIATFTADGVGETRLAPGRYELFVSIPGEGLAPNLESHSPDGKSTVEEFEVREGETLELDVPLIAFPLQQASGVTAIVAPAVSDGAAVETQAPPLPATGHFQPLMSPVDGNQPSSVPLDAGPSEERDIPVEDGANDSSPNPYENQSIAVSTSKENPVKTLKVQVLNRRGEPVVGAVVTPTSFSSAAGSSVWPNQSVPGWREPQPQTTDAAGRAMFAVAIPKQLLALFTPQDLLCRVEHPDYTVVTNHEKWNEGTKIYVMNEGAIIEFTTTAGGATLPAVDSYLLNESGQRKDRDIQVVDGRVRLPRIDAGVREVRAVHIANDGRPLFSPVVQRDLANGATERLALPVEPGVRVEGRLDDAVPRPVKYGRVIAVAIPAGDFEPPQNTTRPSWSTSATINEDGTFVLEDLPAGDDLKVIALCDGYFAPSEHFPEMSNDLHIPWPPQTFSLRDRVNRLTLKMAPTATCEIEARDEQGQPVADAQVVIHTNVTWHLMFNGPYGIARDSLAELRGVKATDSSPVEFAATTNKDGVAKITNVASLEPVV